MQLPDHRIGVLPAGVAAGHPATARIGADVLLAGGSAGDAVAAMILAGSVAETIFTGLGGGGFATFYDANTGRVTGLDFFVAVPGLDGTVAGPAQEIDIQFGAVKVPYMVGGATVCVPGTPAGVAELHRRTGQLPWADIVTPARDLAVTGAEFSLAHAALLPEVAPAMLLGAGIATYSRTEPTADQADVRRLLRSGELLHHEDLAATLTVLAEQGAPAFYTGDFGHALVTATRADGGALSDADLAAYAVTELDLLSAPLGRYLVRVRGNDLDRFGMTAAALDTTRVLAGPVSRAAELIAVLRGPSKRAETTSVAAVDQEGNACAATHSLGLGSGIWVSGVHANSMLGEGELLRGKLSPGSRMPSMMVPSVVTDHDGTPVFVGGAAGGSRIRPALLQVMSRSLIEGMPLPDAISAPRLAATPEIVHLEPGFEPEVAVSLRAAGEKRPGMGGAQTVFRGRGGHLVNWPGGGPATGWRSDSGVVSCGSIEPSGGPPRESPLRRASGGLSELRAGPPGTRKPLRQSRRNTNRTFVRSSTRSLIRTERAATGCCRMRCEP